MAHLSFQDKKIFYRIEGKGKPVFLLHGFGEDGRIWDGQINVLKENYRLIIPDLPGSGQSEMLDGKRTLMDYVEVVKGIADQVIRSNGTNQFCMIGHSMGGYITLGFAEKFPELLNSFGLFHSSAFADDEQKIETRNKAIDFIKKNGAEPFLKSSVPDLFSPQTKEKHPELISQLINIAKDISPEALIQYYEAMIVRPDRSSVLKTFPRPVLFIIGKHDKAIPLDISLQQCHLPSVSSVHILENSGHMGMWEEENSSNTFLKEFLNQIS